MTICELRGSEVLVLIEDSKPMVYVLLWSYLCVDLCSDMQWSAGGDGKNHNHYVCYCDHLCVDLCIGMLGFQDHDVCVTVIICVLDCVGHLCVDFVWVICVLICVLACNEALVSREDSMTMMCVLLWSFVCWFV